MGMTTSKILTWDDLQLVKQASQEDELLDAPGEVIKASSNLNQLFTHMAKAAGGNPEPFSFHVTPVEKSYLVLTWRNIDDQDDSSS